MVGNELLLEKKKSGSPAENKAPERGNEWYVHAPSGKFQWDSYRDWLVKLKEITGWSDQRIASVYQNNQKKIEDRANLRWGTYNGKIEYGGKKLHGVMDWKEYTNSYENVLAVTFITYVIEARTGISADFMQAVALQETGMAPIMGRNGNGVLQMTSIAVRDTLERPQIYNDTLKDNGYAEIDPVALKPYQSLSDQENFGINACYAVALMMIKGAKPGEMTDKEVHDVAFDYNGNRKLRKKYASDVQTYYNWLRENSR